MALFIAMDCEKPKQVRFPICHDGFCSQNSIKRRRCKLLLFFHFCLLALSLLSPSDLKSVTLTFLFDSYTFDRKNKVREPGYKL